MNNNDIQNSFNTSIFNLIGLESDLAQGKYSLPTVTACRLAQTYRGRLRGMGLFEWVDSRSTGLIGSIIIRRDEVTIREGEIPRLDRQRGIVNIGIDQVPVRDGVVIASAPDLIMIHYPAYPISVILYTEQLGSFPAGFKRK